MEFVGILLSFLCLASIVFVVLLGLSGNAGQASSLCPDTGAFTYAATRPMTFLVYRVPRFSTEEERCFWRTEMKFVA